MSLYHTLCTLEDDRWCAQFGDYDLDTVVDEQDDMVQGGRRRRDTYVITTEDTQQAIDEAIADLNARRRSPE